METSTERPQQSIEQLSKRYEGLNAKRIQAQTNLQNAQAQLDALKSKAKQEYGTDDLEELKKILAEMKRKNEEDRAAYQESLDQIETELAQIEEQYEAAEAGQN